MGRKVVLGEILFICIAFLYSTFAQSYASSITCLYHLETSVRHRHMRTASHVLLANARLRHGPPACWQSHNSIPAAATHTSLLTGLGDDLPLATYLVTSLCI